MHETNSHVGTSPCSFTLLSGKRLRTAVGTSVSLMHQVCPVHPGIMGESDRPRRTVAQATTISVITVENSQWHSFPFSSYITGTYFMCCSHWPVCLERKTTNIQVFLNHVHDQSNKESVKQDRAQSGSSERHRLTLTVRKLPPAALFFGTFVLRALNFGTYLTYLLLHHEHKSSPRSNQLVWKWASFLSPLYESENVKDRHVWEAIGKLRSANRSSRQCGQMHHETWCSSGGRQVIEGHKAD